MYTVICAISTKDVEEGHYRAVMTLMRTHDREQALMAAECWADFPEMVFLRDFYLEKFGACSVTAIIDNPKE